MPDSYYDDNLSVTSELMRNHNNNVVHPPKFNRKAITKYVTTRFSSLFVPKEELQQYSWNQILNPFPALTLLNRRQWNFFAIGFVGWTWDALDYFSVSLNVSNIAKDLNVTVKDVTWGITLVLMLRSVGAFIFGWWGDKYGRKWPYIVNLMILLALQIGLGFVTTYKQFLAVRALFGIAMGGVFGNCAATALDDCPEKARGVISGIFQEGYALGYLLAVVFQRAITDTTEKTWRSLFWFSAGPPVLFIIWRFFTPETDTFKRTVERRLQEKHLENGNEKSGLSVFQLSAGAKDALQKYWLLMIYLVLLMSGFNFLSHGLQDLYPTLLTKQLNFGADRLTVTNSVANLGAIFGGILFGHFSTFIGRRLSIIVACILGGAMIYPWAFVRNSGINAGVFFLQAGVQGAWGVIPIHISELSPPQYRSFVGGLAYQLGNLCLSASSTIESTIGERFPLPEVGKDVYDYAKVMAIFIGCVFGYVILITFIGPEYRNAELDVSREDMIVDEEDKADLIESEEPIEAEKQTADHNENAADRV